MGRMMKLAERMREAMERECAEKLVSLNRRLNREFEERYVKQWERNQEALSGWDRDYSELKDRYKLIIANLREAYREELREAIKDCFWQLDFNMERKEMSEERQKLCNLMLKKYGLAPEGGEDVPTKEEEKP